jgi:hypothetical protein
VMFGVPERVSTPPATPAKLPNRMKSLMDKVLLAERLMKK